MHRARTARRRLWALWKMSRPSQLLLIAVVYGMGIATAVARGGTVTASTAAASLAALLPLAASVHYANEYADYETDALTTRTPFSGGSGALQATDLPRRFALRAAAVACVIGVGLAAVCLAGGDHLSPVGAALLAVILVAGWLYSLPPLAFAWRGWGELTNAALGGVLLPLYGVAVVRATVPPGAVLATLPFGTVVFANLLATQWPDRAADAAVGKYTLATRWSARRLRRLFAATVGLWLALVAVLGATGLFPLPVVAANLAVVPLLAWGFRWYTRLRSPLPTVAAMVALAVGQLCAWAWVGGLLP